MGETSSPCSAAPTSRQVASTVADLIAQESTVLVADLTNVYYAANTILYPYYPQARPGQAHHPHHQRDLRHQHQQHHGGQGCTGPACSAASASLTPAARAWAIPSPSPAAAWRPWQRGDGGGRLQLCLADLQVHHRPHQHDRTVSTPSPGVSGRFPRRPAGAPPLSRFRSSQ